MNQVFQKLKLTGIQPIFAIGVDAAVDFTSAKDNYEVVFQKCDASSIGEMDDSSYRLNFYPGKKNKIQYHS